MANKSYAELALSIQDSFVKTCQALEDIGGDVPAGVSIQDLPDIINNTQVGAKFHTVNGIADSTVVPDGAATFAKVGSVGGMTYKSNNLIPFPYLNTSTTINGVEFTVQDDGGIKVKGTASSNTTFRLANKNILTLPINIPITLSGGIAASANSGKITINVRRFDVDGKDMWFLDTEGKPSTGTLSTGETLNYISVYIVGGTTVDATVYPMLNAGSTALPYEPYFEGIRDTKVTELISEGKNLFDISQALNDCLVDNGNGTYTITNYGNVNGTDKRFSKKVPLHISANTTFTSHGVPISGTKASLIIGFADTSLNKSFSIDGYTRTHTYANDVTYIQIYYPFQYGENSETFADFQIEYGTTATEYAPYIGTIDTLAIPDAVQSLPDYGDGVNSEYFNYIDFSRKVFVQRVRAVDMGTLTYQYRVSNNRHIFRVGLNGIQGQISPNIPINAIAADYNAVTCNATWVDRDMAYGNDPIGYQIVEIVDNRYTDVETFKSAVTGKMLVYALAEPIETDISDIQLNTLLLTEPSGRITFSNKYSYAIPYEMKYVLEEE